MGSFISVQRLPKDTPLPLVKMCGKWYQSVVTVFNDREAVSVKVPGTRMFLSVEDAESLHTRTDQVSLWLREALGDEEAIMLLGARKECT